MSPECIKFKNKIKPKIIYKFHFISFTQPQLIIDVEFYFILKFFLYLVYVKVSIGSLIWYPKFDIRSI